MAGPKCPDCGGVLKSDPVYLEICQGCGLESFPIACEKCGTIIKSDDPDEGITDPTGDDVACVNCRNAIVQCTRCDGDKFKKSGGLWIECKDCGMAFEESSVKEFHSESAEWDEWKVKNKFQQSKSENLERPLDSSMEKSIERLRTWESRPRVGDKQKKLREIHHERMLKKIEEICKSCSPSLPKNVIEAASKIYQRAEDKQILKRKRTLEILTAVVYMACRQCDVIRSLEEILRHSCKAKETSKKLKLVARYYRFLVSGLGSS